MNFLLGLIGACIFAAFLLLIFTELYLNKHRVYLMPILNAQGKLSLNDKEGLASIVTLNKQTGEVSIVSTRIYRYTHGLVLDLEHINKRLQEEHLQYHQSVKDLVFVYKVHLDFEFDIPRVTKCTDVLVYKRTKRKGPQTVDADGKESPMYELKQVPRSPVNRLR